LESNPKSHFDHFIVVEGTSLSGIKVSYKIRIVKVEKETRKKMGYY
jgi:hypothetical protein